MSGWSVEDLMKHLKPGDQAQTTLPNSPTDYGNWQRYAGFNPNAGGLQGNMANPANFGSFQQFANMGNTGAAVPPVAQQQPVAPTAGQAGERFGQVMDQLKQGNIGDAVRTYQYGPKPMAPVVKPAATPGAPVQQDQDMMSMEFGD